MGYSILAVFEVYDMQNPDIQAVWHLPNIGLILAWILVIWLDRGFSPAAWQNSAEIRFVAKMVLTIAAIWMGISEIAELLSGFF